jgi:dienelactone hydrolase
MTRLARIVLTAVSRLAVTVLAVSLLFLAATPASAAESPAEALPGTQPLTLEGDVTSQLVDGVDRFLLSELQKSIARRAAHWQRDFSSPEAYRKSLEPNRLRLAHILGVRDPRVPFDAPELVGSLSQPALLAKSENYQVFAVRWPAFGDVHGEGLLLVSTRGDPVADVIALPDADQTPEQICGLADGIPAESQFARRLADSGCRVLVPALINRELQKRAPPGQPGRANLTNREYVYRSAFELGRHLIGYEIQKVLAAVDWFTKAASGTAPPAPPARRIGVIGYGEGGMLALYAAALDPRIDACCVSGYFGRREEIWQQPIDRNVFGLLEQFGDAELATLARAVFIDGSRAAPTVTLPGEGGAPAKLGPPEGVAEELQRCAALMGPAANTVGWQLQHCLPDPSLPRQYLSAAVVESWLKSIAPQARSAATLSALERLREPGDPAIRQRRQVYELDRHNQQLLRECEYVRRDFMKQLDTSSVEKYQQTVERYRTVFQNDVIGSFPDPLLPPTPRTRKTYDFEKWTGYEVVLDVWPDVIAYGVLLLPKDLKPGDKRPVVVCQHGLEGRPTDTFLKDHPAYHDFAAKLCERGFITFAPQNLYIFQDRFRTLQRKANPLKKTLFSIIVPQHQQIVNWLSGLPYVDPDRIGFYGLSYGGKSAMRIPALVKNYCLSICSADFNEWVAKNASTRLPFSYVWTGEYEIFEFDLGSTFNYAEMAALICPRPFMVERGHTDGVSTDEWVSYEFAKVRYLYSHRLKIPDRCEMEVFDGPHTINGQGTFAFLHKHLKWPNTPRPSGN